MVNISSYNDITKDWNNNLKLLGLISGCGHRASLSATFQTSQTDYPCSLLCDSTDPQDVLCTRIRQATFVLWLVFHSRLSILTPGPAAATCLLPSFQFTTTPLGLNIVVQIQGLIFLSHFSQPFLLVQLHSFVTERQNNSPSHGRTVLYHGSRPTTQL